MFAAFDLLTWVSFAVFAVGVVVRIGVSIHKYRNVDIADSVIGSVAATLFLMIGIAMVLSAFGFSPQYSIFLAFATIPIEMALYWIADLFDYWWLIKVGYVVTRGAVSQLLYLSTENSSPIIESARATSVSYFHMG